MDKRRIISKLLQGNLDVNTKLKDKPGYNEHHLEDDQEKTGRKTQRNPITGASHSKNSEERLVKKLTEQATKDIPEKEQETTSSILNRPSCTGNKPTRAI